MNKFIVKTFSFLIVSFVLVQAMFAVWVAMDRHWRGLPGDATYYAINKSKEKNDAGILLIGDSVANQIFPNYNQYRYVNSLTANEAVSMAGHYILIHDYLKTGNEIDKIVLFFTPASFRNNLHSVFTFHYFLKPFYKPENYGHFSDDVIQQIEKIPFYRFVRWPHILSTTWAPNFEPSDKNNFTFLSPVSVKYLNKIKNLAEEYNITIQMIPTPVSMGRKEIVGKFDKTEIEKFGLEDIFLNYFDDIEYLGDEYFIDGIHLINPQHYRDSYLQKMVDQ